MASEPEVFSRHRRRPRSRRHSPFHPYRSCAPRSWHPNRRCSPVIVVVLVPVVILLFILTALARRAHGIRTGGVLPSSSSSSFPSSFSFSSLPLLRAALMASEPEVFSRHRRRPRSRRHSPFHPYRSC